jgi:hypothetical protein
VDTTSLHWVGFSWVTSSGVFLCFNESGDPLVHEVENIPISLRRKTQRLGLIPILNILFQSLAVVKLVSETYAPRVVKPVELE